MIQVVDRDGRTIGEMEKIAAHENGGTLHRAISVFLFDINGRLLIQKRARGKYHFSGLWANSCCSHPTVDETIEDAANRAMKSELGVEVSVKEVAVVTYRAHDSITGHTENEYDHIMTGLLDQAPNPNPDEVEETQWISFRDIKLQMEKQPEKFAPWLPIILKEVSSFTR